MKKNAVSPLRRFLVFAADVRIRLPVANQDRAGKAVAQQDRHDAAGHAHVALAVRIVDIDRVRAREARVVQKIRQILGLHEAAAERHSAVRRDGDVRMLGVRDVTLGGATADEQRRAGDVAYGQTFHGKRQLV